VAPKAIKEIKAILVQSAPAANLAQQALPQVSMSKHSGQLLAASLVSE
jgi:hypothetical protein